MHEQLFRNPRCKKISPCIVSGLTGATVAFFLIWLYHHAFWLNRSAMLRTALQTQVVEAHLNMTTPMPYSKSGKFQFCNLVSF